MKAEKMLDLLRDMNKLLKQQSWIIAGLLDTYEIQVRRELAEKKDNGEIKP